MHRLKLLCLIYLALLILFGAKRLPLLLDGLRKGLEQFGEGLPADVPQFRWVVLIGEDCDRCRKGSGLRCGTCGRLTKKGNYLILGGRSWWLGSPSGGTCRCRYFSLVDSRSCG